MDTRRRVFVVEDGSVDGLAHAFIEAVRRASAGGVDTSVGYLSLRASEIGVSAEDVETLVDANLMSALYGYNHRVSLDTARTCASTHRLAFESIARRIGDASRPTGAYEKRVVKAPRLGPNAGVRAESSSTAARSNSPAHELPAAKAGADPALAHRLPESDASSRPPAPVLEPEGKKVLSAAAQESTAFGSTGSGVSGDVAIAPLEVDMSPLDINASPANIDMSPLDLGPGREPHTELLLLWRRSLHNHFRPAGRPMSDWPDATEGLYVGRRAIAELRHLWPLLEAAGLARLDSAGNVSAAREDVGLLLQSDPEGGALPAQLLAGVERRLAAVMGTAPSARESRPPEEAVADALAALALCAGTQPPPPALPVCKVPAWIPLEYPLIASWFEGATDGDAIEIGSSLHKEIVQFLASAPDREDWGGRTRSEYLRAFFDYALQYCLRMNARRSPVDPAIDDGSRSPLYIALVHEPFEGQALLIKRLLRAGADPSRVCADSALATPQQVADQRLPGLLFALGASSGDAPEFSAVNVTLPQGFEHLHDILDESEHWEESRRDTVHLVNELVRGSSPPSLLTAATINAVQLPHGVTAADIPQGDAPPVLAVLGAKPFPHQAWALKRATEAGLVDVRVAQHATDTADKILSGLLGELVESGDE